VYKLDVCNDNVSFDPLITLLSSLIPHVRQSYQFARFTLLSQKRESCEIPCSHTPMTSSGVWHVKWEKFTDVSEEPAASGFEAEKWK